MRGTTAPRLHLELMCARVLLPGADVDDRGMHARLDRLERRMGMTRLARLGAARGRSGTRARRRDQIDEPAASVPTQVTEIVGEAEPPSRAYRAGTDRTARTGARRPGFLDGGARRPRRPRPRQHPTKASPPEPTQTAPQNGTLTVTDVRRLWPEVLEEVKGKPPVHLDPAQPERPRRRSPRRGADARHGQRRAAGQLRQGRQRGRPAGGADRRPRCRLQDRDHGRPRAAARARGPSPEAAAPVEPPAAEVRGGRPSAPEPPPAGDRGPRAGPAAASGRPGRRPDRIRPPSTSATRPPAGRRRARSSPASPPPSCWLAISARRSSPRRNGPPKLAGRTSIHSDPLRPERK